MFTNIDTYIDCVLCFVYATDKWKLQIGTFGYAGYIIVKELGQCHQKLSHILAMILTSAVFAGR